jgi:hypothetical protein
MLQRVYRRWKIAFAGAALVVLASASVACVMPGSARAAFAGVNGLLVVQPVSGHGVIVVAADGTGEQRVCSVQCGRMRDPVWSGDGEEIVAVDGGALDVIYGDGSCLHCGIGSGYAGAGFAPNGDLLAVGGGDIHTLGLDGIGAGAILRDHASAAVWSATGRFAIVRIVHHRPEVFVTDLQGLHPSQLTHTGANAPSWAPDGRSLAIAVAGRIEIIGLHGRVLRRLAAGRSPAFSPDGRYVSFIGAHGRVMIVSRRGGSPRPVGSIRGQYVDWQATPSSVPPACRAPAGSTIVASSADATVSARGDPRSGNTAYLACLSADGRARYLGVSFQGDPSQPTFSIQDLYDFTFAGVYIAFAVYSESDYHGEGSNGYGITVTNLATGKTTELDSGINVPIEGTAFSFPLAVSADGFVAWESIQTASIPPQMGGTEEIEAYDALGTRTLDSEPIPTGGSPPFANLEITGDIVTWIKNGQPESATLRH